MGKKWMKCALALVMIVAGLAGFLWEFTVVDNDMYTIVDTHYGNRIECHITSTDGNSKDGVGGENADEAVRKALAGDVEDWRAFFVFRYGECCIPGIEWLTEPILPKGYTVVNNDDEVRWYADECVFRFCGELDGIIRSCSPDSSERRQFLREYDFLKADFFTVNGKISHWEAILIPREELFSE